METLTTGTAPKREIEFTKVNHDVNGNPRYVCHFLALINEGDRIAANACNSGTFAVSQMYDIALNKARKIGGRKYHNKSYGGGIIFQSYSTHETAEAINKVREVNTNFKKEWTFTGRGNDNAKVNKAILKFFGAHNFKYIDNHTEPAKPLNAAINDYRLMPNLEKIENLLGLAYTSSGICAGNWICNGVYVMANDTHHFTGFMINELGEVVASVEDENENTIYITL